MSRFERWKHRVQTEQQLSADVKANYGASEAAQWEQKLNALGNRPWQRPEWEEMKKASVSVQLSIPERRRFEMALRQNQELRQFQDGSIVAISHVESKPIGFTTALNMTHWRAAVVWIYDRVQETHDRGPCPECGKLHHPARCCNEIDEAA